MVVLRPFQRWVKLRMHNPDQAPAITEPDAPEAMGDFDDDTTWPEDGEDYLRGVVVRHPDCCYWVCYWIGRIAVRGQKPAVDLAVL